DLAPSESQADGILGPENAVVYRDLVSETVEQAHARGDAASPWGDPRSSQSGWIAKREHHALWALERLEGDDLAQLTVCDVSGGAGYVTFALASRAKRVVHCDLSAQSIIYVRRRAQELGLSNIYFCRADYLRFPFKHAFDRVVCFDTLVRGWEHERRAIQQISEAVAPGGFALIDLHNWWHNPVRRIGLLPNNFVGNRSYRRREIPSLMLQAGVRQYSVEPYYPETKSGGSPSGILGGLLQPTRFSLRFDSRPV